MTRVYSRFLCVALVLLGSAGCGARKPSGKVAGTVTYRGRPVAAGDVNLILKDRGVAATTSVDETGRFAFPTPLDAGVYAVYLTPPEPTPVAPGQAPRAVAPLKVPPKYRDLTTSGLSVTVAAGENDVRLELTD